jgi:hypothetical protein
MHRNNMSSHPIPVTLDRKTLLRTIKLLRVKSRTFGAKIDSECKRYKKVWEEEIAYFSLLLLGSCSKGRVQSFSIKQLDNCTHEAERTPFQTHYFSENLVAQ